MGVGSGGGLDDRLGGGRGEGDLDNRLGVRWDGGV